MIKRILLYTMLCLWGRGLIFSTVVWGSELEITLRQLNEYRAQNFLKETSSNTLHLHLMVSGDQVRQVLEYGAISISKAEDDLGNSLIKKSVPGFSAIKKRLDHQGVVILELKAPPRKASSLLEIKGKFKLRTYRKQVVVISDPIKKMNQVISNELFKAHQFEVRIIDPQQVYPGTKTEEEKSKLWNCAIAVEISGNTKKVMGIEILDDKDQKIQTQNTHYGAGRIAVFACRRETPFPKGVQLKILIPTSPREITVPIHLKNIQLP